MNNIPSKQVINKKNGQYQSLLLFSDAKRQDSKKSKASEVAAETIHILNDALSNFSLKGDLGKLANSIGLLNAFGGLFFLSEGVKDIKEGIKEHKKDEVVHGIEHTSLSGASLIDSLSSLNSFVDNQALSSAVSLLGPIGSALGVIHGTLETYLALKDLKNIKNGNIENNSKKRLKILDALSSVAIGTSMIASAFMSSPILGFTLFGSLAVKLALALRQHKEE